MTITAEEASAQFLTLLDQVAGGEQVTITRQGVPVVNLVPVAGKNRPGAAETIKRIEEFSARQAGKQPPMRELIEEGRRH